ncbi:MAG: DUF4173 domain-containing protein [Candidatus Limnocylindria bacterium]
MPALADIWLGPAAVAFSAFAAIRADPAIVTLDMLTALALVGAALASFGGRSVVGRSFGGLLELGVGLLGWATGGAAGALAEVRRGMPSEASVGRRASPAFPILRGLAIALPVVLIFVALFSAADAVFAQFVDDVLGTDLDLGNLPWRTASALVLAWFGAGGMALAASDPPLRGVVPSHGGWRLGTTEVVTVLIAVVALFAVFVALQGAYLFGGLDTLEAAGLTYAEYARRGFFELVAVAALAAGLVMTAERLARDRTRLLIVAATGLGLLTSVVLVSATLRLRLYQEAYGWTELRLYVLATIVLLAIGLAALIGALVADRVRWIGHVLVAAALAIGLALNLVGPVRFITQRNVARALDPALVPPNGSSGLDVWYATSLGDDAIPDLIRALPVLADDEGEHLRLRLEYRLDTLRREPGLNAWQAWNAGRAAAHDALDAAWARGDLP